MTISRRIFLLVSTAFLALLIVGGYAVVRSMSSQVEVHKVTEGVVPSAIESVALMGQLKDVQIATLDMVAAPDAQTTQQKWDELKSKKGILDQAIQFQMDQADSPAQKGLVREVGTSLQNYFNAIDDTARFKLAGQKEMAEANLAATVDQYLREQGQVIAALQIEKKRSKDEAIDRLNGLLSSTVSVLTALSLAAIAGMSVLGWLLYRQIVRPIGAMQQKMTEIATSQDYSHRLEISREDEIGQSMRAFNAMIGNIEESAEQVRQKTADIHAMLRAVPQGILTLQNGCRIHPEYSEHLLTILERKDIAGQNALDIVFGKCGLGADEMARLEAAIDACVGEDLMNYDFNAHLLPAEVQMTMDDGRGKILDLHWAPVASAQGLVDRMLLVIRDVTQIRALEKVAQAQRRELKLIGEILGVRQEKFQEFIDGARRLIASNRSLLGELGDSPGDAARAAALPMLLRQMHTIKGNARTCGLLHLTNGVHEAEQSYDFLRRETREVWPAFLLQSELEAVSGLIEDYARINDVTLGRQGPAHPRDPYGHLSVPRGVVDQLCAEIEAAERRGGVFLPGELRLLRAELDKAASRSLSDVAAAAVESLPSLASELGKPAPRCTLTDRGVRIRSHAVDTVRNILPHLYRNALDHGLESASERTRMGKPPAGTIDLELQLHPDRLAVEFRDDGRGLALERLRERARTAGLLGAGVHMSDEEIAQLVFHSGLSTAASVTEVSGRGVGMDAVRAFVQSHGGSIRLDLLDAAEGAPYRPFGVRIELPSSLAVQMPDIRKEAAEQ